MTRSSIIDGQLLNDFQDTINSSGLKWTFTKPDQKVVFMDLTISIKQKSFSTNLYEKPLALHLYIPPHSCHPPGCFSGLIRGMILRIYRLCSKQTDKTFWLKEFMGTWWTEVTLSPWFYLHLSLPSKMPSPTCPPVMNTVFNKKLFQHQPRTHYISIWNIILLIPPPSKYKSFGEIWWPSQPTNPTFIIWEMILEKR